MLIFQLEYWLARKEAGGKPGCAPEYIFGKGPDEKLGIPEWLWLNREAKRDLLEREWFRSFGAQSDEVEADRFKFVSHEAVQMFILNKIKFNQII